MIGSATVARANAFVEFDLVPTPLRLWDGVGTSAWNGVEWTEVGSLASVSGLNGNRGLVAQQVIYKIGGLTLGLSGQIEALKAARRRKVTMWLVVFDSAGIEIKRAVVHRGRIDAPSIQRSEGAVEFEIPVETLFVGANRISWNLFTDTDQQQRYPGDRALEQTPNLNGQKIVWP